MWLIHHHFEFRDCNPGGVSFKKLHFLRFYCYVMPLFAKKNVFVFLSEYILHVEINHSLCQNSKLPNITMILFSLSAVRWGTWIPTSFSIELCSRVNHARRASASLWDCNAPDYRAHYWVTTAQNWCRDSATEIGRKIAKTTRDVKMFNVL